MATPDDLESRLSAVEHEVALLRERQALTATDAAAARTLAAGADHDVSEVRAELRAHTSVLNALRQTQVEFGRQLEGVGRQLEGVGRQLDGVGQQLEGQRQELDGFGQQLDRQRQKLDGVGRQLVGQRQELDGFGQQLDGQRQAMDSGFAAVDAGLAQIVALLDPSA